MSNYTLPVIPDFVTVPTLDYTGIYTELRQYRITLAYPAIPNAEDLHKLCRVYDKLQAYRYRCGEVYEASLVHCGVIEELNSIYQTFYKTISDILVTHDDEIKDLNTIGQREASINNKVSDLVSYLNTLDVELKRVKVCLKVLKQRLSCLESTNFNLKDQISTLRSSLDSMYNPNPGKVPGHYTVT